MPFNKMDSFMDNLTLGMVKYLESLPCVNNVTVIEKEPVEEAALILWKQRNNCILPPDLQRFYSTTDGLQVKWNIKVKGEPLPGGCVEINSLSKLRRVAPKRSSLHSELPTLLDIESDTEDSPSDPDIPPKPKFKKRCQAFLLDNCQGSGKVCLVYQGQRENEGVSHGTDLYPTVWFLDRSLEWHYLAPDFSSYFRLVLAHLGILHWQYLYTPMGPPLRSKQLLKMFVPEKIDMTSS